MIGIEAARLFVSVGEQGVDSTLSRLNSVGAAVDSFASQKKVVSVGDEGVNAVINDMNRVKSAADSVGATDPIITPHADVAPAIGELNRLKAKISEVAASGSLGSFSQDIALGRGFMGSLRGVGSAVGMGMSTGGFGGGVSAGVQALGPIGIGAGATLGLGVAALGKAGEMERYQVQLGVLLGSVEKARERIADLTQFATTTPFELPEVVMASRQLQVFTGDALSAGEGLRLVGDVAAGTGSGFGETAMWFGRMYDALQSGRPFGEATMRLQEMGALGGKSREKIEALAKSVKDGTMTMAEAWPKVTAEFGRFSGMMGAQSNTLEGKLSNLTDAIGQDLAKLGTIILPAVKAGLDVVIGAFTALGNAIDFVSNPLEKVEQVLEEGIDPQAFGDIGETIARLVAGPMAGSLAEGMNDALFEATEKTKRTSAEMLEVAESEFRAGERSVGEAAAAAWSGIASRLYDERTNVATAAADIMQAAADAIASKRQAIIDAVSGVAQNVYDPIIVAAEISAARVELAEQKKVIASKDSTEQQIADAKVRVAELGLTLTQLYGQQYKYLDEAGQQFYIKGQLASGALAEGLASGSEEIRREAKAAAAILITTMEPADLWGFRTGDEYIDGLIVGIENRYSDVQRAVGKYKNLLRASSPPDSPDNPLHDIGKFGYNTGQEYIESMARGIGSDDLKGAFPDMPGPGSYAGSFAPPSEGTRLLLSPSFHSVVPYSAGQMEDVARTLVPLILDGLAQRGVAADVH